MLLGVVGVVSTLTLIRIALPTNLGGKVSESKGSLLSPFSIPAANKRIYRAATLPSGTASIGLTRSKYSSMPLIDMNDRGDNLFLVPPPNLDAPRQYIHVYNNQSVQSETVPPNTRWVLTATGKIIARTGMGKVSPYMNGRSFGNMNFWAFNELRFMDRFNDDGSFFAIQYISERTKHSYALAQFGPSSTTKAIYHSEQGLALLERTNDGTFWMSQEVKPKNQKDLKLIRYKDGTAEEVPKPNGYTAADRVAQNGKTLAITFGNILGEEPIRSFVQSGDAWKELPVPEGSVFSYVQKVFNDGLILGFVTDANRENVKPVIWDGNKVTLLENLKAWPKRGKYSVITSATRRGDIYVRNVLNTESGATENYLMHVSRI